MYRQNTTSVVPLLPDAAIQPLDSSARNPLICMGLRCGLCGLRASSRERGRSEEWPGESGMWPGTANSGGWRSPQAFGGTRTSTRELARSGKKKPQPLPVGVLSFGGGGRSRTAVRRHSISGTTCLAHRWVSSRGSTACEAHPGTSLFWVDRALTGNHSRRSCDDDPTSTSTGTSGFGATP